MTDAKVLSKAQRTLGNKEVVWHGDVFMVSPEERVRWKSFLALTRSEVHMFDRLARSVDHHVVTPAQVSDVLFDCGITSTTDTGKTLEAVTFKLNGATIILTPMADDRSEAIKLGQLLESLSQSGAAAAVAPPSKRCVRASCPQYGQPVPDRACRSCGGGTQNFTPPAGAGSVPGKPAVPGSLISASAATTAASWTLKAAPSSPRSATSSFGSAEGQRPRRCVRAGCPGRGKQTADRECSSCGGNTQAFTPS